MSLTYKYKSINLDWASSLNTFGDHQTSDAWT